MDLNVFNNRITALPAEVMALEELRVRASQPLPVRPGASPYRTTRHPARGAGSSMRPTEPPRRRLNARGNGARGDARGGRVVVAACARPRAPAGCGWGQCGLHGLQDLNLAGNKLAELPPIAPLGNPAPPHLPTPAPRLAAPTFGAGGLDGDTGLRKVEKLSLFWNRLTCVPPLTGE